MSAAPVVVLTADRRQAAVTADRTYYERLPSAGAGQERPRWMAIGRRTTWVYQVGDTVGVPAGKTGRIVAMGRAAVRVEAEGHTMRLGWDTLIAAQKL